MSGLIFSNFTLTPLSGIPARLEESLITHIIHITSGNGMRYCVNMMLQIVIIDTPIIHSKSKRIGLHLLLLFLSSQLHPPPEHMIDTIYRVALLGVMVVSHKYILIVRSHIITLK